jgi:hypothetical protein
MAARRVREEMRWGTWEAAEGRAGGGRRLQGRIRRKKREMLGFTLLDWWVIIGLYSSFAS